MLSNHDPAWPVWIGRTIELSDGTTAIVRMARRGPAGDSLWAVDRQGTMHHVVRSPWPRRRCAHLPPDS